jgi:hypothetical protein
MPDGTPHVAPVWFVLDGEEVVFTTCADSAKGRNLRRAPRGALVIDDEEPPFAFVHVRGVPRRSAAIPVSCCASRPRSVHGTWARTPPESSAAATLSPVS